MSPGSKAWIGLTAYVAGYDAWAAWTGSETLSSAFYRSFRHPVRRMPILVLWAYLTAHLFHLLPDRWDPLRRLGGLATSQTRASCTPLDPTS